MSAVKALQQWCRIQCEGYRDVSITNMTTSFRDGLAFCALIHRHRPDLINFDSLKKEDVYENNKLAFSVAEQHLQIPALLDAEDMVALRVPDRLSILTYVSQYYNYFHGRSPIGGMAGVKRPAEGVTEQHPAGKKNAPVAAKVFPSSGPTKENLPPMDHSRPSHVSAPKHSSNKQDVPQRPPQTGTLSNKCVVCNQRVHLVQRHLVEGKLYHRNCAKTLTGNPFSTDLPKNSSLSRLAPAPDPEKTNPRPAPSWLTHKPSAPSSVSSNTLQREPANTGPIHTSKFTTPKVSPSPKTSAPSTTNSITPSPQLARSTKANIPNSTTATSSSTPTPAPRTSIAAKNLQAKMKFFSDAGQEKGNSAGTKSTEMLRGQREEHSASHSVTLVVQVGEKDRKKEREKEEKEREMEREREREREKQREREKERESVKTEREKQRERERVEREEKEKERERARMERERERVEREKERERERERVRLEREKEREKEREREREREREEREREREEREKESKRLRVEREQSQAKASAAMIISKKLTEENNNKPVWSVNQTKHSPAEEPKKEGVRGRVKLRANPSLLSDLNVPTSEDKRFSSPKITLTNRRSPSPSPAAPKLRSTSPHPSGAQSESPSDWRARLKPVSKDPSPKSSTQPQSKPWTNGSDLSQSTGPKRPAPAAPAAPAPWITVTVPSEKGSSISPRDRSTEKDSNKAKTKVDYIPQEEILRELQQIEESLNDLEKTGVELELKLRTSEENGEDESVMNELMVEWFTLIKNKQLSMRRESELVYVGRNQELEEEQPTVEQELRRLLDKPEHLKTPMERRREGTLMKKLVEIVNDRNAIVEGLDEDRLREEEEDEQLNQLMMNFNLKVKDKSKKKSPISRLFNWSSKDS